MNQWFTYSNLLFVNIAMIFIVNTSRKRFLSGDLNANIVIDVSKKEIKTLIKFDRYRLKIIFWCNFPSRWEAKRVPRWSSPVLHHCSLIKETAICHSIKQTCRVLLSREMKYCWCQHCTEDLFCSQKSPSRCRPSISPCYKRGYCW